MVMDQTKIWDYFQTQGVSSFDGSRSRLEHLATYVRSGDRVLNIGIGNGYFETVARSRGGITYSLDPSDKAVILLRERLQLNDEVKVGFSNDIPFANDYFDTVVMSEVIEHLTNEQLTATGQEIFRVLKPNGLFLGSVPGKDNMDENLVVCPDCGNRFHKWGHLRVFNFETLGAYVRSCGFEIVGIKERCFVNFRENSVKDKLKELLRFFAHYSRIYKPYTNFVFAARKPNHGGT